MSKFKNTDVYSGKTRDFFGMLYKGSKVGMVIALPHKENKGPESPQAVVADIEAGFTYMFKKGDFDVVVEFPKFKMDYECDVVSSFKELGITDLFTEVFLFFKLAFHSFSL
jgi:serine protease inhibitor